MAEGKVLLKFDVFPSEKERLEKICKTLGIAKITFLRNAMLQTERQLGKEEKANVWEWNEALGYCVKVE